MNQPPPEDDLKDMFVVLEPPPGGLQRFRRRRETHAARPLPWLVAGALAGAAALVLWCRPPGSHEPPNPAIATAPILAPAPDLLAGRDPNSLHPAWVALGRLAPPSEPLQLAPDLRGALASRRVPIAEPSVVLYMLDPRE